MQTFLPYDDFLLSAACLDNRRLGKQRVEALQIHNIVSTDRRTGGWVNHPAVVMWRNAPNALAAYQNAMIDEWVYRGFNNTMKLLPVTTCTTCFTIHMPTWIGDERVHSSHRSNLLRKAPDYYADFGWGERDDMPYFWPTNSSDSTADSVSQNIGTLCVLEGGE